jgi:hypothetical protein
MHTLVTIYMHSFFDGPYLSSSHWMVVPGNIYLRDVHRNRSVQYYSIRWYLYQVPYEVRSNKQR